MGAYLCKDAEHAKQAKQENNENAMLPASEKLKSQDKDVVVDGENPDIPFADATGDEEENVETEKIEINESPVLLTEAITVDIIKNVESAPSEEEKNVVDQAELARVEFQSPEITKENDLTIEDSVVGAKETVIENINELEVESIEKAHEKCDGELDNQEDESEPPVERSEIKTEEILVSKNVESEEAINEVSTEFDTVVESHDMKLEEEIIEHVEKSEESEQINDEFALEINKESLNQFLDVDDEEVKLENTEVEEIENFPKIPFSCEDEVEAEVLSEHKENDESNVNFSDIKEDSISNADEMILEPEFIESEKECSPEIKELKVCDSNVEDIVNEVSEKESSEIKELEVCDSNVEDIFNEKESSENKEFEVCDSKVEDIVNEVSEKESSEIKELEVCDSNVEDIFNEKESSENKEFEVCDSKVEDIVNEVSEKESSEIKELEVCDSNVEDIVNEVSEKESSEIKELEVCDSNVEDIFNEKESSENKEFEEVCDSNVEDINDEVVVENPIELDQQNVEKVDEEVSNDSLLISEEHPAVYAFEKQEFEVPELGENEESSIDIEQKEQNFIPNESTPESFEATEQEKVEHDAESTCNEVETEPFNIQNINVVVGSTSNEEIVEMAASKQLLDENEVENIENVTDGELSETKVSIDENEPVEILESKEESLLNKFSENSIVEIDLSTPHISTNGNVTCDAHESDDQSLSNEIEIENGVEDVKDEELKKMVSDAVDEIMGDAKSQVQHIVESPSSKDSPINVLES